MEQRIGELATQADFTQVSISSTVSPLMKLVSRGDTTTVLYQSIWLPGRSSYRSEVEQHATKAGEASSFNVVYLFFLLIPFPSPSLSLSCPLVLFNV
jgi:N-methylhydantoinase A/oxoprolinase/acetone carboxylase beta subunit